MKEDEKRFKVIYTQGAMTCILFDEKYCGNNFVL